MQDFFTLARTTASIPLELGPSTDMPSTNNVDRMNTSSLVTRHKRSNSELNVDGLALLASTAIAEWDHNGQHNHRHKPLGLNEMKWLEKFNQLKEFYHQHGHAKVPSSYGGDNSLCSWVHHQRHHCKIEKRRKMLKAIGFVFNDPKARVTYREIQEQHKWQEKYNELKQYHQTHGHTKVPRSYNLPLHQWMQNQRNRCTKESRIKLLKEIGLVCLS